MLTWEALYTGTDKVRPASYWAAESAAMVLAEALEQWLWDETVRAETLRALEVAIAWEKAHGPLPN